MYFDNYIQFIDMEGISIEDQSPFCQLIDRYLGCPFIYTDIFTARTKLREGNVFKVFLCSHEGLGYHVTNTHDALDLTVQPLHQT